MDVEALKEQWSEVEDRDGLRLSWNVFPSSRMVSQMATDPGREELLKYHRRLRD
jgi:protein transport protein SEC23